MIGRRADSLVVLLFTLVLSAPASGGPSIDDFLQDRTLRDAEVSPDGTHLATITEDKNERWVMVRNLEEPGMPVIAAWSNDVNRPSLKEWGNDDRLLISMEVPSNTKKLERKLEKEDKEDVDYDDYYMYSRMVAVDRDLTNLAILFEGEWGLRRNRSLSRITNFLPDKPDHVLMSAYVRDRRMQYEVNINTGEATLNAKGSPRTVSFLNDRDGTPRFRIDYRWRPKILEIWQYTENEKWDRVDKLYLSKDDEDGIDTNGLIGLRDDDLVYRKRNEESGYYDIVAIDRTTSESRTIVSLPDQDVRGLLLDTRTDEIIGYTVETDLMRFVYFDEARQSRYDAIAEQVGKYNFHVSRLMGEGAKALVRTWGADDPLSYYLWHFETEKLSLLGQAYKGLETDLLSMPAMATYMTRDGVPIRAYLLLPVGFEKGTPHPTVILPHGGPHSRSRLDYDEFAQFLSTRGYIVIQPNFRGSVGYGRDFEEAGYRQWGGVMQDDVTDAVDFMVRQGYTDPERVCIVGASYGGYAALMGAIKTPDLYQCAISLNGVTHLEKLVKFDMKRNVEKEEWQRLLFDRIGHPRDDREMLDANSPALHADKISIPVLIVAGTDDDIVPYSQSKLMVKALKKADVDHEFIRLADTGHNPFYWEEDVRVVFAAIEEFLAEHLQ